MGFEETKLVQLVGKIAVTRGQGKNRDDLISPKSQSGRRNKFWCSISQRLIIVNTIVSYIPK
jgi:hypothetical protein